MRTFQRTACATAPQGTPAGEATLAPASIEPGPVTAAASAIHDAIDALDHEINMARGVRLTIFGLLELGQLEDGDAGAVIQVIEAHEKGLEALRASLCDGRPFRAQLEATARGGRQKK